MTIVNRGKWQRKKVNEQTSTPDIVLATYIIQIHTNYSVVELISTEN